LAVNPTQTTLPEVLLDLLMRTSFLSSTAAADDLFEIDTWFKWGFDLLGKDETRVHHKIKFILLYYVHAWIKKGGYTRDDLDSLSPDAMQNTLRILYFKVLTLLEEEEIITFLEMFIPENETLEFPTANSLIELKRILAGIDHKRIESFYMKGFPAVLSVKKRGIFTT
jgi:hypothetical protein